MSWLDTLEEVRKRDWNEVAPEERASKAREIVTICSYAGAAASAVPVPLLADVALLLPVHSVMVMTVGHMHGRKLTGVEAKRVVLELGAIAGVTFAGRVAVNALSKLVPGYGTLISMPATFALTWALGRVSIEYFANPKLSREELKTVFNEAIKEGKSAFSKEAFDRFRQKNADAKAPEVEDDDEGAPEAPANAPPEPPRSPSGNDPTKRKKRTL